MDNIIKKDPKFSRTWKHFDKIAGSSLVIILFSIGTFWATSKGNDNDHDKRLDANDISIKDLYLKYNNIVITQAITPEQIKAASQRADRQQEDIKALKDDMKDSKEHINTIMDITLELYEKQVGRRYTPKK